MRGKRPVVVVYEGQNGNAALLDHAKMTDPPDWLAACWEIALKNGGRYELSLVDAGPDYPGVWLLFITDSAMATTIVGDVKAVNDAQLAFAVGMIGMFQLDGGLPAPEAKQVVRMLARHVANGVLPVPPGNDHERALWTTTVQAVADHVTADMARHGGETALPLRIVKGADGGIVVTCVDRHENGPCGQRWLVGADRQVFAERWQQALFHVGIG